MSTTAPLLACQRDAFSLPGDIHYLNCAYMGPLPRVAQEAGIAGIRQKAAPTDVAPDDFFRDSDIARAAFGGILGAPDARRVAIMPSVSYGIATAARNLRCAPGQRIITAAGQFPSNVYAWRRLASASGAEVVAVAAPDASGAGRVEDDSTPAGDPGVAAMAPRGERWSAAILEAIDERTAIVALPHVHWTDGTRFDLERIAERARSVDAAVIIDGTQSIGAMDFDIGRIRPDAVVCAAYKWLLGPYGLAFGWFGERFDDGVPLEETWIGRARSHDFQRLVDYTDAYQDGAIRYDVGERSNFVLLPMAIEAMRVVAGWGTAAIQAYCDAVFQPLVDEAVSMGCSVEDRRWRGAHLFGLRVPPGTDLDALQTRLRERRIYASLRGTALRLAPHVYNDARDCRAAMAALRG